MNNIHILIRNQVRALENLRLGEIESIEEAVNQVTDDFMIMVYAVV
jgi:hypothetical protein